MDKGWTNRPVTTLKTDALLFETKQATYDSGFLAGRNFPPELESELKAAIARREECFVEIENRLKGRKA